MNGSQLEAYVYSIARTQQTSPNHMKETQMQYQRSFAHPAHPRRHPSARLCINTRHLIMPATLATNGNPNQRPINLSTLQVRLLLPIQSTDHVSLGRTHLTCLPCLLERLSRRAPIDLLGRGEDTALVRVVNRHPGQGCAKTGADQVRDTVLIAAANDVADGGAGGAAGLAGEWFSGGTLRDGGGGGRGDWAGSNEDTSEGNDEEGKHGKHLHFDIGGVGSWK